MPSLTGGASLTKLGTCRRVGQVALRWRPLGTGRLTRFWNADSSLTILWPFASWDANAIIEHARSDASTRQLRLFIAARSRYAEDSLRSAVAGGVRQLVVLGAGLDTFAYRSDPRVNSRIYEVDHPATQEWKRARLSTVVIAVPRSVTYTHGSQSLNIEGRTYRLKDGSPAVAAAAHLTSGQSVTVQLDGPASSPSSRVINVVPRTGR